jgi:opacity protein-like surface antigen
MRQRWVVFSALFAALAVLVVAIPASAEWYVEPYAGIAFSDFSDVKGTALGTNFTLSDPETEDSFAIGGRGGYWADFAGLGLDFIYYKPDTKAQNFTLVVPGVGTASGQIPSLDVNVYGIGLDVLLRLPLLKSETLPQGRVQPYVAAGPVLFITDLDGEDTDTSVGVKVGAGVAVMLTKNFGLFAEYRFSHHQPEFEQNGVKLEGDINTHFGLVGLATRF